MSYPEESGRPGELRYFDRPDTHRSVTGVRMLMVFPLSRLKYLERRKSQFEIIAKPIQNEGYMLPIRVVPQFPSKLLPVQGRKAGKKETTFAGFASNRFIRVCD